MKPLATLFLFVTAMAHAQSHEDIVARAFETLDESFPEKWAFTETVEKEEGSTVATHDPDRAGDTLWMLVSVDGQDPTDKEIADFRKMKGKRREAREESEDGGRLTVGNMVRPGSLELIEETDEFWLFGFSPVADSEDDEKFMRAVDGTLQVVKDGHYVAWLRMQNRETVKPGKGVKLETFDTRLEFTPAYEGGPVLPAGVRTEVKGKAFVVVKFNEIEKIRYSDFQPR